MDDQAGNCHKAKLRRLTTQRKGGGGVLRFSREPWIIRSVLALTAASKKTPQKRCFSLVDDQGLEAGCHSKNEAKTSKKHAKSARFEGCAPIMPQYAPKKSPNKNPEN